MTSKQELSEISVAIQTFLSILSFLASLVNVVVMSQAVVLSTSINVLLLSVECANMVMATLLFINLLFMYTYHQYIDNLIVFYVYHVLQTLMDTGAFFVSWMSVVIIAWRLKAVRKPFDINLHVATSKLVSVMVCIVLIGLLPFVWYFASRELVVIHNNSSGAIVYNFKYIPSMEHNDSVKLQVMWVLYGVGFFLPCFLFLVLTVCLIASLHYYIRQMKRENQFIQLPEVYNWKNTFILIFLLILFLISNGGAQIICILCNYYLQTVNNDVLYVFKDMDYPFTMVSNILSVICYYHLSSKYQECFKCIIIKIYASLNPCFDQKLKNLVQQVRLRNINT